MIVIVISVSAITIDLSYSDSTDSITQGDTCTLEETGEYHDRDKEAQVEVGLLSGEPEGSHEADSLDSHTEAPG